MRARTLRAASSGGSTCACRAEQVFKHHADVTAFRLRRRGDLTFWLDEAALDEWQAPRRTTPGGQPRYSALAVELALVLRLVFGLALRPAEAFSRSVLRLLGLDLAVPDHSTLSGMVAALPIVSPEWPGVTAQSTWSSTAQGCSFSTGDLAGRRRSARLSTGKSLASWLKPGSGPHQVWGRWRRTPPRRLSFSAPRLAGVAMMVGGRALTRQGRIIGLRTPR